MNQQAFFTELESIYNLEKQAGLISGTLKKLLGGGVKAFGGGMKAVGKRVGDVHAPLEKGFLRAGQEATPTAVGGRLSSGGSKLVAKGNAAAQAGVDDLAGPSGVLSRGLRSPAMKPPRRRLFDPSKSQAAPQKVITKQKPGPSDAVITKQKPGPSDAVITGGKKPGAKVNKSGGKPTTKPAAEPEGGGPEWWKNLPEGDRKKAMLGVGGVGAVGGGVLLGRSTAPSSQREVVYR